MKYYFGKSMMTTYESTYTQNRPFSYGDSTPPPRSSIIYSIQSANISFFKPVGL
jgi:hypothetical protein